jgi:hypothetical protein
MQGLDPNGGGGIGIHSSPAVHPTDDIDDGSQATASAPHAHAGRLVLP